MEKKDSFLQVKALAHALDKLIQDDAECRSEDIDVISMMLVQLVDEYDKQRA